jgi:hypothetical protein
MSFGSSGFSGFGGGSQSQNNNGQQAAFGGFGSTPSTNTGMSLFLIPPYSIPAGDLATGLEDAENWHESIAYTIRLLA